DRQLATASTDETARIWALLFAGDDPPAPPDHGGPARFLRRPPRGGDGAKSARRFAPHTVAGVKARWLLLQAPPRARRLVRDDRVGGDGGRGAEQRARDHLGGRVVLEHNPRPPG